MTNNFPQNLKAMRTQAGIKIKHVSDETEINRETIYDYEKGRTEPTIKNLVKLATFFGVSLDQLVYDSQP